MHTHNFQHWLLQDSLLEKEARVCRQQMPRQSQETPAPQDIISITPEHRDISGIHEVILRGNELQKNPELGEAKKLYAHVIETKFPELNNPVDRANFFALLFDRLMKDATVKDEAPGVTEYSKIWKVKGTTLGNPWNIDAASLPAKERAQMDELKVKFNSYDSAARPGERERPVIPLEVITLNVQRFADWKADLDALLQRVNIPVQRTQVEDPILGSFNLLSRHEYFILLSLIAEGDRDAAVKIIEQAKDPGDRREAPREPNADRTLPQLFRLRKAIWAKMSNERSAAGSDQPPLERLTQRRLDLTLEEMGPGEVLRQCGIHLGHLRHRYICERRAALTPAKPGEVAPKAPEAALWIEHPELLHEFLLRHGIPQTVPGDIVSEHDRNQNFLFALQFYFPGEARSSLEGTPKYSKADTVAIVALISKSLALADSYATNAQQDLKKLQTDVNTGTKFEGHAREIWEYMKDFRDHPAGSIAMMAVVGMLGKTLFDAIFDRKNNRPITNILGLLGIGGVAAELFYQNKEGKSLFFSKLKTKVDALRNKELAQDPDGRTIGNYWAVECKLTDPSHKKALTILEEQPANKVLAWYEQVGSSNRLASAKMPPLPFRIKNQSEIFGNKSSAEISQIFFDAFTAFLTNRGRAVKTGTWLYQGRTDKENDAAIGLDYIKQRYVEKRWFTYIGTQMVQMLSLYNGAKNSTFEELLQDDTALQELKKNQPKVYGSWVVFKTLYIQDSEKTSEANDPLFYIFTLEMDEGMASRLTGGNEYASLVRDIKRWTDGALEGGKNVAKKTAKVAGDSVEVVKAGAKEAVQVAGDGIKAVKEGVKSVLPGEKNASKIE